MTTTQFTSFDEMMAQGKKLFGPVVDFNEITARTMEEIARQQFDLFGQTLDFGVGRLQAMQRAEDLTGYVEEQGRVATEFGARVKDHAEATLKTVAGAQKAYAGWVANVFQAQSDAVASATRAAKSAAQNDE